MTSKVFRPPTALSVPSSFPEDKLTVLCKLLKLQETKIVGQGKYTVANAIIGDSTAQIGLDISNNLIPHMKINRIYKITNLSARFWNGITKLTTTTNSVLSEIADGIPTTDTILQVPNIESIESID